MGIVKDNKRFIKLIETLEAGWEIEEPVLLGAMWRVNEGSGTYHFVLRNKAKGTTTLLSLPPSPQLLLFLAENNINISAI
jgi:hypothetical protein